MVRPAPLAGKAADLFNGSVVDERRERVRAPMRHFGDNAPTEEKAGKVGSLAKGDPSPPA